MNHDAYHDQPDSYPSDREKEKAQHWHSVSVERLAERIIYDSTEDMSSAEISDFIDRQDQEFTTARKITHANRAGQVWGMRVLRLNMGTPNATRFLELHQFTEPGKPGREFNIEPNSEKGYAEVTGMFISATYPYGRIIEEPDFDIERPEFKGLLTDLLRYSEQIPPAELDQMESIKRPKNIGGLAVGFFGNTHDK